MKNNKNTINQSLDKLSISRASLYNHLKRLDIRPIKEGRRVYLLDNQIDDIKAFLLSNLSNLDSKNRQVRQDGYVKEDKPKENIAEKIYKEQISELKKELEKKQEKIEVLIQDVGRWEGVARTLQDQNQKLLEFKPEDKSEIEEVEIIEQEPEKIGIFQKIINFRF